MNLISNFLNIRAVYRSPYVVFPQLFVRNVNTDLQIIPEQTNLRQTDEPDKLYKIIKLEMRANEPSAMRSYTRFAKMAAGNLGIEVGRCWSPVEPFKDRVGYTLLRSAFVKKKKRVQYELRTYYRFMNFHRLTGSTADTFLEYIERNLPEGISLKVTKVHCEKLPEELTTPLESDNEHEENENEECR